MLFFSIASVLVLVLLVQVEEAGAFAVFEQSSCFIGASNYIQSFPTCQRTAQKTQQFRKATFFSNKDDVEIVQETNEEGSPPQTLDPESQSQMVEFRRQRNGRQRLGGSTNSRSTQRRRNLSGQRSGVRSARSKPVAFDPSSLTKSQKPNHDAVPFHLNEESSQTSSTNTSENVVSSGNEDENIGGDNHRFEFFSLDDLFPGTNFSKKFDESQTFREELRQEIRQVIFDHNPSYSKLPTKARQMLLSDGSSVEGSWFVASCTGDSKTNDFMRLTEVLKRHLDCDDDDAPTGEQLISTIGHLCGSTATLSSGASFADPTIVSPSGHFIDIIGRKDRLISHSWHQDTGRSGTTSNPIYTVLWGFPPSDNYCGTGVYSHMIPLEKPHIAKEDHPTNEPILFPQILKDANEDNDKHIIKPLYQKHCEILRFKDTHYLHSAPDVTYRSSLMRFM